MTDRLKGRVGQTEPDLGTGNRVPKSRTEKNPDDLTHSSGRVPGKTTSIGRTGGSAQRRKANSDRRNLVLRTAVIAETGIEVGQRAKESRNAQAGTIAIPDRTTSLLVKSPGIRGEIAETKMIDSTLIVPMTSGGLTTVLKESPGRKSLIGKMGAREGRTNAEQSRRQANGSVERPVVSRTAGARADRVVR
jgi:hypothetical protein